VSANPPYGVYSPATGGMGMPAPAMGMPPPSMGMQGGLVVPPVRNDVVNPPYGIYNPPGYMGPSMTPQPMPSGMVSPSMGMPFSMGPSVMQPQRPIVTAPPVMMMGPRPVVIAPPAILGRSISMGPGSYGPSVSLSSGHGDQIEKDVRAAWKHEQVRTLESVCNLLHPTLSPHECGKIVKALWKENQSAGARIIQRYCPDQYGFRGAMKEHMWMAEFSQLGI